MVKGTICIVNVGMTWTTFNSGCELYDSFLLCAFMEMLLPIGKSSEVREVCVCVCDVIVGVACIFLKLLKM